MDYDLAKKLYDILVENGEDAKLREDYVGRGTWGEPTTGVVFENFNALFEAFYILGIRDGDYGMYDFMDLKIDQLGLRYIIY